MDSQIIGFNRSNCLLKPNSSLSLRFRVFGAPKTPFLRSNFSNLSPGGNFFLVLDNSYKCM